MMKHAEMIRNAQLALNEPAETNVQRAQRVSMLSSALLNCARAGDTDTACDRAAEIVWELYVLTEQLGMNMDQMLRAAALSKLTDAARGMRGTEAEFLTKHADELGGG